MAIINNIKNTTYDLKKISSEIQEINMVVDGTGEWDGTPTFTVYRYGELSTYPMSPETYGGFSTYYCRVFLTEINSDTGVTLNGTYKVASDPELTINNNVEGTTASYVVNGNNFDITLTGDKEGTFDVAPKITWYNKYNEIQLTSMNVDGKTATFSVPTANNTSVKITGTFNPTLPKLTITNNVEGTTASYVVNGDNFDVTLTGDKEGEYTVTPTVNYNGSAEDMTVSGKNATISFSSEYTECVINGTFTPDVKPSSVPVTYNLVNANSSPRPTEINIGDELSLTITPNDGYKLDSATLVWSDGTTSTTVNIDTTTGNVSFYVPENCVSITINATASVIVPVGANYGAINVYLVTLDNLDAFSKKRFFTLDDNDNFQVINLGDYVNRIKRVFVPIEIGGTDTLKCGNYNTGIQVNAPKTDIITVDFGNVTITGLNSNSNDYSGTITLFIPFKGFVNVNSGYFGKEINLTIKANIITGDGIAILSCDDVPFQFEDITISRDVIYRTGEEDFTLIGGQSWGEQNLYGLEPYLLLENTKTLAQARNNTNEPVTIGNVTGYAQFENVNLEQTFCLADEYNEILNLLSTGVYL